MRELQARPVLVQALQRGAHLQEVQLHLSEHAGCAGLKLGADGSARRKNTRLSFVNKLDHESSLMRLISLAMNCSILLVFNVWHFHDFSWFFFGCFLLCLPEIKIVNTLEIQNKIDFAKDW